MEAAKAWQAPVQSAEASERASSAKKPKLKSPHDETPSGGLKEHQFITPGPPPLAPSKFNPDFGAPHARTNATAEQIFLRTKRLTNSVPPSELSPVFNPDPGASSKKVSASGTPFYTNAIPLPPVFTGENVPEKFSLPRSNVRSAELEVMNVPPGTYGSEPLPKGLELPRENTRGQKFIHEKWEYPEYHADSSQIYKNPPFTEPAPDRWRIGFAPWRRYTAGNIEQPYETPKPKLWHPYHQSILKGDAPIIGQDIFLNLIATSDTIFEARRIPTGSGVSGARPNNAEFFGQSEQFTVIQNFGFTAELFRGDTVFQPVHWAVILGPVFNINYNEAREAGILNPDPRGPGAPGGPPAGGNGGVTNPGDVGGIPGITPAPGSFEGRNHTTRKDDYLALQQWSVELHLRDLSDNYDFFTTRIGNQVFNSDFRGFIFNDINLGWRIFGNYDNNRWQYNVVAFDMREKDTNSELNRFSNRDQYVFIANLYKQDFLWHGYTAQWSFHANLDRGQTHYDKNGNLARPAPLGTVEEHDVSAYYFGWTGDGHIGRWNLSHAFYQVFGRDELNGLAGRAVDINAQMAALELSYDRDWIRYKASVFYASGDGNAEDGEANGFDTILDNPNFTGGPFSWYVRQGFNLAGSAVGLKQRNSLVMNFRTSKTEGQANFVNPGVLLLGVGSEIEVTPRLRSFLNFNYIRFVETDPIKTALLTQKVAHDLGFDLSLGVQYRPLLTDNIIISAGFGVLIPGKGFKDIYQTNPDPVPGFGSRRGAEFVDDFLYSGLIAVTFTY